MSFSSNEALELLNVFESNPNGFGVTVVKEVINDKAEADCHLEHRRVSPADMLRHLNGEVSIGLSPLLPDNTITWAAIDIDNHDVDLRSIVRAIIRNNLPILPCYSKSKKLHMYFFFQDHVPASSALSYVKWYLVAFGLNSKTEIFPKQDRITGSLAMPSWINLPFFGGSHRFPLDENMDTIIEPSAILSRIRGIRMPLGEHLNAIKSLTFYDAPPCVLTGALLLDVPPGGRNNWLFAVGVFLKMKYPENDLDTELRAINEELPQPIPLQELEGTILKGFQEKTYFYPCKALERCNKAACRKANFGVESKQSSGLEYGALTQVNTDPPTYVWEVNGIKMTFNSESELLTQSKFRQLCIRTLHVAPRHVKDDVWTDILNKAMEHITVIEPEIDAYDFSTGSTLLDAIRQYFLTQLYAENITQVTLGRTYKDVDTGEYVFTARSFLEYIHEVKKLKWATPADIRNKLVSMHAHKEGPYWRIPIDSIGEESLPRPEWGGGTGSEEVDF